VFTELLLVIASSRLTVSKIILPGLPEINNPFKKIGLQGNAILDSRRIQEYFPIPFMDKRWLGFRRPRSGHVIVFVYPVAGNTNAFSC
jgi:hypothetical protein